MRTSDTASNQLLPGMLHLDMQAIFSRIGAAISGNALVKIPLFLDWDDTITDTIETGKHKKPIINQHIVETLATLFDKYSAERFELYILSARAKDPVVKEIMGDYATIQAGIKILHSSLTKAVTEALIPPVEALFQASNIYCLMGLYQYLVRDADKVLWKSGPFSDNAAEDKRKLYNEAIKYLPLNREGFSQAFISKEHVLKADFLALNLTDIGNLFFIFIDDNQAHLNAMQQRFPNALSIKVEPAKIETASLFTDAIKSKRPVIRNDAIAINRPTRATVGFLSFTAFMERPSTPKPNKRTTLNESEELEF